MLSPDGTNSIVVRLIVGIYITVIEILVAGVGGTILSTGPIVIGCEQKDYGITHLKSNLFNFKLVSYEIFSL